MVTRTLEFHFDFGSPNAYLVHRALPQIAARTGVETRYVPILLGGVFKATGNRSPIEAFGQVANKLAYMQRETERFVARHAISDYNFNPHFPVNTLAAMRGAIAAQHLSCFAPYVETIFRNMWSKPKKLDDPAVLHAVLEAAGLPAARLLELAQTPEIKQSLARNTEASVARGNFGSPTFFVGDEMFFGKDQLECAFDAAGK